MKNFNIFIGNIYLLFSFLMFLFSGILILGVRMELFYPGVNFFSPEFFNSLTTTHGLIMIFGFIMPSFTGLSYWIIPNILYNNNLFFSKLSFFSFFMLIISLILILLSFFLPFGNLSVGWTMYTPISIQSSYNIDFIVFSIYFLSFSNIINSLNFSLTILNFFYFNILKMPIFLWSIIISSYLTIIIMPIFSGLMTMLIFDRYLNTSFFNPVYGGDVVMYQHLFWFFGHPEVYVLILPSFGIISQVITNFSKRKIFSYNSMVYSIISISLISLLVWGHHMFVSGIPISSKVFFMYCTMLISIPTGIKVFNWLFTIWRGFLYINTPFLFSIGFIFFFILGGFSGIMLSSIPIDIFYHGTYFVVAHFHYILVSSSIFSIYSSFYYWSPIIFNIKYNDFFSELHFWFSFIFLNLSFFPMHFLGFKGMPRRYIDYSYKYIFYNKLISFSSFIFGVFQLFFFYFLIFPILCF